MIVCLCDKLCVSLSPFFRNDAYVHYGFTFITEKDGTQRPQCVLCGTMFSNSNLKPSKLDEHFKNRHGGVNAGNDIATLQVKRARFDRAGTLRMYGFSASEKPLLLASYEPAYQIVKEAPIPLERN